MPRHPWHVVGASPWPFLVAVNVFSLVNSVLGVLYLETAVGLWGPPLCLVAILGVLSLWWRDIIYEGTHLGHHTSYVQRNFRYGFNFFLLSEAFFFVGLFWSFFHSALNPAEVGGCCWPPVGIEPINPYAIPLFNTALLLSSGVTVTWGHHALRAGDREEAMVALALTVLLGGLFTAFQLKEYYDAPFTMADGIYGSCFYMLTGFHGLHVIIGTIFLLVNLGRTGLCHFSPTRHLGLDFAVWYWHFVDGVWILLYLSVYIWWG